MAPLPDLNTPSFPLTGKEQDRTVNVPKKTLKMCADTLGQHRAPFSLPESYPSKSEVVAVIPPHCFQRSTFTSMLYAIFSVTLTLVCGYLGYRFLPEPDLFNPLSVALWLMYGYVCGTIATGCWVVAHECGHGAFSDNEAIQTAVGFVLHSALLVPYFSWQRSHAVHHSRTNHVHEGESHVPSTVENGGAVSLRLREFLGEDAFSVFSLFTHLVVGWPAYLIFSATGGPARGRHNHFIPTNDKLYPGKWKLKVLISDLGLIAVLAGLYWWAQVSSWTTVLTLYGLPYLFTNMWLVLYTWLQHTDVDVPHYDASQWNWLKGAFATIDRPYPQPIDFLHHKIGSTHVAHHLFCRIPHYHAREATDAIRKAFPEYYLYDPTPIMPALLRIAANCVTTQNHGDGRYFFTLDPAVTTMKEQ